MATGRFALAACLAAASAASLAQTATSSATMNTQAGSATSSLEALPPTASRPSAPTQVSRPTEASAPNSGVASEGDARVGRNTSPNARIDVERQVGGSGSAGLAAMGGGVDPAAMPTSQMGAGSNLMPDCPMGMVRYMGLCMPYAQAQAAQKPNKAQKPR
ncbi:hypothetical protein [Ramlibacter algicola]|uniref:Fe-S oxidoreductase n=1 Tax=Ramlibacter algicola TaxID=2795217 RepID=A0A934Q1Q1_9BURK|nr:hypothetical protein [Ramlibacter algicola]MBK0393493.1 hypothetical protein [Ramlibacter algicola]